MKYLIIALFLVSCGPEFLDPVGPTIYPQDCTEELGVFPPVYRCEDAADNHTEVWECTLLP